MPKNLKILIDEFNVGKLTPKVGALKIYNIWFGRPYDNLHKISNLSFLEKENILEIDFDEGERLTLWSPKNIQIGSNIFEIKNASKIKWEWYLYGEDKTEINKRFWVFKPLLGFIINITSNDEYLKSGLKVKSYKNALEIL